MSRRKRPEEHENHEAWAIPYGDLVTLLLAFFVVMYAMSTVNEGKYRVLSDSLSEAFNGVPRSGAEATGSGSSGVLETPRGQVHRMIAASLTGIPAPANDVRAQVAAAARAEAKASADAKASASDRPVPVAGPETGSDINGNAELGRVADEVTGAMGALVSAGEVRVRRLQNSVVVDISADILFSSGVAKLSNGAAPPLQHLADALKPFTNAIRVEGHTDDRPISTTEFPSNWELSSARAASVVHLFMDRGITPDRLAVMGFGPYRPMASNDNANGRNANRRVAVVILDSARPQEGSP
jgi:chemotaxis protein MotB